MKRYLIHAFTKIKINICVRFLPRGGKLFRTPVASIEQIVVRLWTEKE